MDFDRQPSLAGELVAARPLRRDDFDSLRTAARDPAIWVQHPEPDRWRDEPFRAYFEEQLASGGSVVVLDRANGAVIGASRYDNFDASRSEVEVGWTFLACSYWGGRYNADLKRIMLEHAFRSVETVVFLVGERNLRSRRAIEKLQAKRAGRRRGQVLYELTAAAYRSNGLVDHGRRPDEGVTTMPGSADESGITLPSQRTGRH